MIEKIIVSMMLGYVVGKALESLYKCIILSYRLKD